MADAPNTGAPAAPQAAAQPAASTPTQSQGIQPLGSPAPAAKLNAIVADPNAAPATKAAATKMLKAMKIKVDGQEYDETLPFEIDGNNKEAVEYMKKHLQFSKVSQKRMGEKAQLETEVRQFLDQLKSDPRKVLADPAFGIDLKKIAAQMIEEEIANAAKSPEQLAREQLEAELKELKDQRDTEKKASEEREFERIQQMEYDRYDSLMTTALAKSDLPKSPYVVKKMADYMMMGLKEGIDVTPEDVLPLVREEILEDIRQMSQAMPLETIEKLFGGDILTKIRKNNVAKSKAPAGASKAPKLPDVGATKSSKADDPNKKKITIKQMFGV